MFDCDVTDSALFTFDVDYDDNDDTGDYRESHKNIVKQRINRASKMARRKGKFGDKGTKVQRGGIREYQDDE